MIKYKRSMCVHNTYKSSVLKTESVFITDFFLLYAVFITGTYGVHNRYNGVHNRVFIIQCYTKVIQTTESAKITVQISRCYEECSSSSMAHCHVIKKQKGEGEASHSTWLSK